MAEPIHINVSQDKPKKPKTLFGKILSAVFGVLLILMVAGAVYEKVSEASDARRNPPPGKIVDVNGYQMHLYCTGEGSPTVVIDAGLGDWSTSWANVQPLVAEKTRVCTYDRAGYGWSEIGLRPRTSQQIVEELHTLLQNAGEQGPFVLVGHSFGGYNMRLYAATYADETAGLVLIDPSHPEMTERLPQEMTDLMASSGSMMSTMGMLERLGLIRLFGNQLGLTAPNLPQEVIPAYFASLNLPRSFITMSDEFRSLDTSAAQAGAVTSLGGMPLIVLSNGLGQANPSDYPPDFSSAVIDQSNQAWQEMQDEIAGLSSSSQHLYAENSHHNIQFEQPQAAVDAILQMVEIVR